MERRAGKILVIGLVVALTVLMAGLYGLAYQSGYYSDYFFDPVREYNECPTSHYIWPENFGL